MLVLILANPHLDVSERSGERLRNDRRRHCVARRAGNANYAALHHFLLPHRTPQRGATLHETH